MGVSSIEVTERNTAKALNSGALEVFSTPSLTSLVEHAAWNSVLPYLEEGQSTVGTMINIRHLAPTPVGMTVYAESELIEVDGRRLVFRVRAYDGRQTVCEGTQERYIVDNARFMAKAVAKLDKD